MKKRTKKIIKGFLLILPAFIPFFISSYLYRVAFQNLENTSSIWYFAFNSLIYIIAVSYLFWAVNKLEKAFKK